MARSHGQVPPGWTWRDGRPRWKESPALREAGWKGLDLKDPKGAWLPRGASIDRAEAIAAAVKAWRAGAPVPLEFAAIAPVGAAEQGRRPAPAPDKLAIGRLADAWTGDPKATPPIKPSQEFAALAPGTQRDYRGKLKRLVDTLAGHAVLPARHAPPAEHARYAARVAELRAFSVLTLEPVETADGIADPLYDAYWALHASAGVAQASGVLAVASVWLAWCRERQSRSVRNWAAEVSRETPPGRIRPGTWPEIRALIEAADALGLASIGDSIVLGLDLSWSQTDRLALTWPRLVAGRALTGMEGRKKTGRVGGTPLTSLGLARVAQVRARQEKMAARPTHVLWCELTGRPWKPDHYRHQFALVRAAAARACPSVADFTDADLRDTAYTWGKNAGLDDDALASRTLQSRKNIKALGDKHYGEIGPEIADRGRDLYDAYLQAQGVKL